MPRDASPLTRLPGARRAAGYTLVELLVLVVVLSILAGIAGIATGVSGPQQLDMAELQIRDAIEWAQAQARSNRAPVAVVFDPAEDRFALVDEAGAVLTDPFTHGGYVVSFRQPNQPHVDLLGATFGAAGRAAIFDAQGVPLAGGTITLDSGGHSRVLAFDPATGSLATP